MKSGKSVDEVLFPDGEPTPDDAEALLAQYRLFVETSEALVVRRQSVNTFFLSVNSIVLAAAGLLLRDGGLGDLESIALTCLSFGGAVLCVVWWRLISSFQQLSKGKFDVIHALERRLPARIFAAEWVALGFGKDPKKYKAIHDNRKGYAMGLRCASHSRGYLHALLREMNDEYPSNPYLHQPLVGILEPLQNPERMDFSTPTGGLAKRPLIFRDYSVPKDDPNPQCILGPSTQGRNLQEDRSLSRRGHSNRDVRKTTASGSKRRSPERTRKRKPILGVNPWGQKRISSVVRNFADETVGWNRNSVVSGIWGTIPEMNINGVQTGLSAVFLAVRKYAGSRFEGGSRRCGSNSGSTAKLQLLGPGGNSVDMVRTDGAPDRRQRPPPDRAGR